MSAFELGPGGLTEVDGSAKLVVGNTRVIVSVTGPIEPKIRQELPTQASLEIIVRPSKGVSTTREKYLEDLLRSVLQLAIVRFKYPRQLIQIVVQFLATDSDSEGSVTFAGETVASGVDYSANELSAALNCCYFALIDANVSLYNSFSAVTLALNRDGKVVSNPNLAQLQLCASHHVVCFDIKESKALKILLVESEGTFSEDELVGVVEKGSVYCEKIHVDYQRPAVEKKIRNDFIWAN